MRFIDYQYENEQGDDVSLRVEYLIIPFKLNESFDDDVEIINVIEQETNKEVELDDETLSEVIEYIRDNNEDYLGEEFFL
jgi:hypothetical protein